MIIKGYKIKHFKGDQAYILRWIMCYDCRIRISSLKAHEKNLEVFVTEKGDMLAWRYDHPEEIKRLIKDDGKWEITNQPGIKIKRQQIELLCRDYQFN
jgi:predicted adenine nucleotide alpha hydrolase (AANH) superfamily ATPase